MLSTILILIIVIVLIGLLYRFLTLEGSDKKELVDILTEKGSSGEESPKETGNELLDRSFFFGFKKKNKVKYPKSWAEDNEDIDSDDSSKKVGVKGEFADVLTRSTDDDPNIGKESGDIKTTISKDFPFIKNDEDKSKLDIKEVSDVKQNSKELDKVTNLEKADIQKIIDKDEEIKEKYEESRPIGKKISDAIRNNKYISGKNKKGTSNKLKVSPLTKSSLHSNLDLDTLLTHTKEKKSNHI